MVSSLLCRSLFCHIPLNKCHNVVGRGAIFILSLLCIDLGSDLLDELEQAKYFPTRDAACRSIQQQLEKLSTLTKEHATLLEDCEKRLKDCVGICQLQQQANEVS